MPVSRKEVDCELELKNMTYLVVELSFRENNPVHRSVAFHRFGGHLELFGSYEGVIYKNVKELSFFRVVEEIKSMTETYSNQNKLPSQIRDERVE